MHASLNVGYQGKSGPGKIHEVILVDNRTKETHCFTRQGENCLKYFDGECWFPHTPFPLVTVILLLTVVG